VSYGFGLMIESLVAILLLVTIGYCVVLNNRLKRLKADEQSLKATISELITATEMAERAVAGLKTTAREAESTLGERLKSAERSCTELARQVAAGDSLANRLGRAAAAGRALDGALPEAPSTAPDPNAVAAAARSFADKLRERVNALAA
jgi:hypothetical protein